MGEYRIRWARIQRCNGRTCWPARMCIAERRVRFLWLFPLWWPAELSKWRDTEAEAERDIQADKYHQSMLPKPRLINQHK